jgi:hypothetical protein
MKLPTAKTKPVTDLSHYTFLIYGNPKSGKSTLASKFDRALFLAFEPGHKFLEIFKIDITSWEQVRETAKELIKTKDEHKFKTIVFDTADIAYALCERYVCNKLSIDHPSDLGFGKGYQRIRHEFMYLINILGQHGFGLVFISHSQTREKEERNRKFSYTDSTLSGSAQKVIHGLCDIIMYSFIDNDGRHLLRCKANEHTNAGDRSGKLSEFMLNDFAKLEEVLNGDN